MSNVAHTTDPATVAERVRALMSRRGIGKRQQTTELCRILELSFSQGHRKLRGESPWTLAQITKVAAAFGEPAGHLFGTQLPDPYVAGASAHEARLYVNAAVLPCVAWIGTPVEPGCRPEFIAYETQGQWRVVRPDGTHYQDAREVLKIEISPRRAEADKPLVAVVDDDRASADNLRDYLEQNGYAATAHYGLAAFEGALANQVYDAVVIDWLFGAQTAGDAIRLVRASENPDAPIFVLTGELLTGKASESEISEVVRHYDVACYEKPARMAILVADLSKRLNRG
ncbi:MAG: response regulator [Paraburkholderia sp.]|uniref:helix-turn-helix domain-containing protein n=1 Tax=Paraburkholderia sp. TaxID=1926495 RepID=UPI0011FA5091|nr:helix-turn-helix domain-containing protein [Paraburkholderia sp.]TAM06869.1 MAG: response regulator [Paraburkholderia sp.]TAM28875.1 MAG: response regulator [Paraburkholderia sp.]